MSEYDYATPPPRFVPEQNEAELRSIYGEDHVDAEPDWSFLKKLGPDIRDNRDPETLWKVLSRRRKK
jgi:hypothetical protein